MSAPSPDAAATSAGPSAFTPSYGAPEQFDKKRGASGPWTDVFALALVYVELASGERALSGDEVLELFRASTDPALRPTLRAHGVEAPAAVERVLARALAVDPADRYADAGAFWDALTEAVSEEREGGEPARDAPARADDASMSTAEYASAEGLDLHAASAAPPRETSLKTTEPAPAPAREDSAAGAGAAAPILIKENPPASTSIKRSRSIKRPWPRG